MNLNDFQKNSSSDWVKYSSYEYKTSSDGDIYIVPSAHATVNIYNPLQSAEKILLDALNIGRFANETIPDVPKIKDMILAFATEYGLLGYIVTFPLSMNFMEKEDVLLGENPLTQKDTMRTFEYIGLFTKFLGDLNNVPRNFENSTELDRLPLGSLLNRPLPYEIAFGKGYSEKLEWIYSYFKELYLHLSACFYYDRAEDSAIKNQYLGIINAFKMYGLGYTVKMIKSPTIVWDFRSLKIAIDTIYGFYITNDDKPLRICKHCGKVFVSTNQKVEFCSGQCRNQFNVYKSRKK